MARKFHQGVYEVKNPAKYLGNSKPIFRSGWERAFMNFCDNHPSIVGWVSEGLKIPYRNPISGKQTIYVPDFLIHYIDKSGKQHAELIEIKPLAQTHIREGKMKVHERATVAVNHAKWAAAHAFCKNAGITFRIVTEQELFAMGGTRK